MGKQQSHLQDSFMGGYCCRRERECGAYSVGPLLSRIPKGKVATSRPQNAISRARPEQRSNLAMGILCFGAPSALLCGEDKNSILGLNGCGYVEEEEAAVVEVEVGLRSPDCLVGDGFPLDTDELVGLLVEKEMGYLPDGDYLERLENGGLESSWRTDAIDWICKVHSYYNFGPLSACLSVNYLDRFLSSYELPNDKSWMQQLLSVACLSLAVKMDEAVVPLPLDLQVCDATNVFEARTIKRMELLVLSTLQWRMQAVTPLSFVGYFLSKFNEGKPSSYALVSRCFELIVATLKDTSFLQFRPSEITAAVVLSVISENQVVDIANALAACKIPVNKERVVRCHGVMQEKALVKKRGHSYASPSVPQSPSGVLDAACFSFRSDDTTPGSLHSNTKESNNNQDCTPASKRRRLGTTPI